MTLCDMSVNETGVIIEISLDNSTKKRLLAMGIYEGVYVTFLRTAPFNGCVEFSVLGYKAALRQNEAKKIIVERVRKT